MSSLPPEVERARTVLRAAVARPGAEARIYRRIVTRPRGRDPLGLKFGLVTLGLLLAASAAYGLGFVARTERAPKVTQGSAVHQGPPRQLPRSAATKIAAPAEATSVTPGQPKPLAVPNMPTPPNSPPGGNTTGSAKDAFATVPLQTPPAPVSELSQQVANYREAVALLSASPEIALESLLAHRRHWPNSAIVHEVDLRIIQALVSLGRRHEAQNAARRFLERYPDSARVPEVRRIAESDPSGSIDDD
jgi:hypothetical protein